MRQQSEALGHPRTVWGGEVSVSVKMGKWEQLASSAWEGKTGRLAAGAQRRTPRHQDTLWAASIHSLRLRRTDWLRPGEELSLMLKQNHSKLISL